MSKSVLIGWNCGMYFIGASFIGLGIYAVNSKMVTIITIMTLIMGIIYILNATVGIIGANKRHPLILIYYLAILVVLLLTEFLVGIDQLVRLNSVTYDDALREKAFRRVNSWFKRAVANDTDAYKAFVAMQRDYHCCGVRGPNDWVDREKSRDQSVPFVPDTCVLRDLDDFDPGCTLPIYQANRDVRLMFGVIIVVFAIPAFCGLYFGFKFLTDID